MRARHRPLSDSEREERRRSQRKQLEDALAALLSSEGWRRWLRTRAALHTYSAIILSGGCRCWSCVGFARR